MKIQMLNLVIFEEVHPDKVGPSLIGRDHHEPNTDLTQTLNGMVDTLEK